MVDITDKVRLLRCHQMLGLLLYLAGNLMDYSINIEFIDSNISPSILLNKLASPENISGFQTLMYCKLLIVRSPNLARAS